MVPLTTLVIPILLSAVIVFVASSIIHMVLPIHRNDIKRVPDEDAAMNALRPLNIPPGDYVVPHVGASGNRTDPALIEKMKRGPVVFMTVLPAGAPAMGSSLLLWFLYCVLVTVFAAYIGSRAVPPVAPYLEVFRFVGTSAFMGYSLALLQNSIWYKRNWAMTIKTMLDGLVYALLTAGVFGWLWPR